MSVEDSSIAARIYWLDYARLGSAIAVMLYHFAWILLDPRITPSPGDFGWLTQASRYGVLGVDLFFMISGFVILNSAEKLGAGEFVARRWTRLYPGFLACLTITAIVSIWGPAQFRISVPQYAANLTMVPLAFGYRYADAVYWTLGLELIFYAAVAALLFVRQMRHVQWLLVGWVAVQAISAVVGGPLVWLTGYASMFAAGAALALFAQHRNVLINIALIGITVALSTTRAMTAASRAGSDPIVAAFVILAFYILFVVMGMRRPHLPGAQAAGRLTYPLYLLHFHVGGSVLYWLDAPNFRWQALGIATAAMVALAWLVAELVERRPRKVWLGIARRVLARPIDWLQSRVLKT